MSAAIAGALLAAGLLLLVQGLFPKKLTLAARLAQFDNTVVQNNSSSTSSLLSVYGMKLLETVKGDKLEMFASDLAVAGSDLESAAENKLQTGAMVAGLLAMVAVYFGFVSSPIGLLGVLMIGGPVGYAFPDLDLKKSAAERRVEFSHTLTTFMTLLTSSMSGGGGLTTALDDAASMGDGWVFDHIQNCLARARLEGTTPWVALEALGQRLNVVPLIELSGALTLAGASGARVTETLAARANSSRQKELSDVRAEAEAKSSKLGVPVGMIMMTWMIFIVYPAISTLMDGI